MVKSNMIHMNLLSTKLYPTCLFLIFTLLSLSVLGQNSELYPYEASEENPFGLPNPDAPESIKDFAPLIGECDCESISRNPDQTWAEPVQMLWRFKYIMNGYAIQDETLKADGIHSGSIRQFDADSSQWYVHYYSISQAQSTLPTWEGSKVEDGNIILYRSSEAPDGTAGFYKITFYNIREDGFDWLGEWVNTAETIHYPLWEIACEKRKN